MRRHFGPEFLNQLDETIVFRQLTKVQVKEIAAIMLNHVAARVSKKGIELLVTERFKELEVEEVFDLRYGVRPLKRAILRLLEDTLLEGPEPWNSGKIHLDPGANAPDTINVASPLVTMGGFRVW
ncbi:hypothetical protein C2845_PM09G19640 [Panicum miliaceum]|uniref:Clp ATPase C-terminal domain-containing protein n=1 Tax=Panicum miliaceum TaxID=4540 RepID=A0A3L6S0U0_PANMI|nr:hypothetical protein C2845_PM09G19640 [Panicum miliaceum]